MSRGGMVALRLLLGAGGVALASVGGWVLLFDLSRETPRRLVVWLAGAVVVHDLLLAPAVLLLGLAVRRLPGRAALRGALLAGGCATLIALPPLLRPGEHPNPTVLPLDYQRNLLIVLLAVAGATLATAAAGPAKRALRRRHRTAPAGERAGADAGGDGPAEG